MIALLVIAATATHGSRLELISMLQHQYPQNSVDHKTHRRALVSEPLTASNTRPMRFELDFASLYEATAPEYSTCFTLGAWYRRGLPRDATVPPTSTVEDPRVNGVETCDANGDGKDCWARCRAEDILTPAARDLMIAAVTQVAAELSTFFSVRSTTEPLVFPISKGRYQRAVLEQGWTPVESCASDCTMLSGVAVDSTKYCTSGVEADAVISLRRPPSEVGVAGTGSYCQSDSDGRPTWLVFNWIESTVGLSGSVDALVSQYRHLIYHEIIHALGFSNSMFISARDANGDNKRLLKMVQLTDTDGATDEIWHFVQGRAYEMGQAYFGCANSSSWHGVPLMGLPDSGRASHWETRVLRDDVMSYGRRATVSSLTLAAMEDLGFYLANYSAAGCMSWGYKQGCEFVKTRCGRTFNDQSATPGSSSDCTGDPDWASTLAPSASYLASKCKGGLTPCSTITSSGFSSAGGVLRCNAQCYTSIADRTDCSVAPVSQLASAGSSACASLGPLGSQCIPEHYLQWIILGGAAVAAILAALVCRELCCPRRGSTSLLLSLSIFMLLIALCLLAFATYCIYYARSEDTGPLEEVVASYVGQTSLWVVGCVGIFIIISCVLTIVGVCRKVTCLLVINFVIYLLLLFAQVALIAVACYWISLVNTVTSDTLEALRGTSSSLHSDQFGAEVLREAEGLTCRLYQTCCWDPALDSMQSSISSANTCRVPHAGTTTDIATSLEDPSSENFCPFVTGARLTVAPAAGVCELLDFVMGDFQQSTCQADFCTTGVDGYFSFVQSFVSFLQTNAYIIGGVLAAIALFQLMLLVNLWNVRRRFVKEGKSRVQVQPATSTEMSRTKSKQSSDARVKPPRLTQPAGR
mmetsp:Transcript_23863/g.47661  ORF Transcript_23863/g.47661 Transcript_23863/m.47661 type:complete len:867 (-) Transcript_23863:457-3057(-)